MNFGFGEIWVYLEAQPLLWLSVTLAIYLGCGWLFERTGRQAWLSPAVLAIIAIVGILLATGTSYQRYFDGAQFVHFLLGPVTVAMAVPLYTHGRQVRRRLWPIVAALVAGVVTATVSALLIGRWLGASKASVLSLAPKSVTTPVAMGIAEKIGGLPSLTAAMVVLTGMIGAVIGSTLFRWVRVRDTVAWGFAFGVAAHGLGTARAFQVSELCGAFAGLGMGLASLATAGLLPPMLSLIGWR